MFQRSVDSAVDENLEAIGVLITGTSAGKEGLPVGEEDEEIEAGGSVNESME
jgi:hypothetical protein